MNFARLSLLLAAVLSLTTYAASAAPDGDVERGRRLYMEGAGANGAPVSATVQDGAPLDPSKRGCAACHRASGFGSVEGGVFVPPITGPLLFNPRKLDRNRLFKYMYEEVQSKTYDARLRQPHMRPGYTRETLARALASGVDASGQSLSPVMPRYEMGEADLANLTAFLQQLSVEPSAGVTPHEINIATIIGADVGASRREAILSTLRAYVDWANRRTDGDASRGQFSPYHRSDQAESFRNWRLHIWELKGSVESWRAQLEAAYAAQPVFAVIGGATGAPFDTIADFCDSSKLPCLFPVTDMPKANPDGYSLYFHPGVDVEGAGLAVFLLDQPAKPHKVIEFAGTGPSAARLAAAFEKTIAARRLDIKFDRRSFADATAQQSFDWSKVDADTVAIWPDDETRDRLSKLLKGIPADIRIVLPSNTLSIALKADISSPSRVFIGHPRELPSVDQPQSFRLRAWMRSRGIDILDPMLQYQTYYAIALFDTALGHMNTDFFQDYLIEAVEHESAKDFNPGFFPSLALAPGQRFACNGLYVVRLDPSSEYGFTDASGWFVP